MQFHLNGFKAGDPDINSQPATKKNSISDSPLPQEVDVLIVGCGPAGLTLAAQLSAFKDIRTCIVDVKPGPLEKGQADGIACRTVEMFNAFGFAEKILREAYWVNETTFWKPDPNQPENIIRGGQIYDTEEGLSEFPHLILNQARVHDYYLQLMRNSPSHIEPFYSRRFKDLKIQATNQAKPLEARVVARFERANPELTGQIETVRAKFLVGCDGARSEVRKSIGRNLVGDSANQAWGVMDVLATTDFPDIRMKSLIQSAEQGSILIIPREGGYLVRIYVEMDKLGESERVTQQGLKVSDLIERANRVFHPYHLEVKDVVWWSVYEIGQRLTDKFDDVNQSQNTTRTPCVFIAGDACHTHSPKAGQGMNVSMGDAFNLGWKLAAVVRGLSPTSLLTTYSEERQAVAQRLIDFDREWSKIISSKPKFNADVKTDGYDPAKFQEYFVQSGRFTAGTAIEYSSSPLTKVNVNQHLAKGLRIGMRFHSSPVIRLSDGKPLHLGHVVLADGRWRIFAFAGQSDNGKIGHYSPIRSLCDFLQSSNQSPVRRYTNLNSDIDSVIDFRVIFQQSHRSLEISEMPNFLLPSKGKFGLTDYEKIFCPDLHNQVDIFDTRQIDRALGCMVIVRPDQYISAILKLDDFLGLRDFFEPLLIQQNKVI